MTDLERGELTRIEATPSTATSPVALRWEWRTFARSLPIDRTGREQVVAPPEAPHTEIYLLSARAPHNVKVRNARLEIKTLERSTHDGIELWRPALTAPFPLSVEDLQAMYAAWELPNQEPAAPVVDVATLLRTVVDVRAELRAVVVSKQRSRLVLDGCPGERATLLIDGAHWETLAFEHVDAEIVRGAVQTAGLASLPATSYPAALKAAVGFGISALALR